MNIKIVTKKILIDNIKKIAEETFGAMAKAVVDIEKDIMAVGGELHADAEAVLIENGSKQENIWGINIFPYKKGKDRYEFTALINIRPSIGNRSMEIENLNICKKITVICDKLIKW